MFPYHRNDSKLNPNPLPSFKDYHNEEHKNFSWNRRKDYRGQQLNLNYKDLTLLENKLQIIEDNNRLAGNTNKQTASLLPNNDCIVKDNNDQEASSCNDLNVKNNTNLSNA